MIFILAAFALTVSAQGELVIVSPFQEAVNNLTAAQTKYKKLDYNGNPCALIIIGLVDRSATFTGNVIYSEYKQGEWWVYMTEGSTILKIKTNNNLPKEITFPKLKKLTTYKVSFISNAPNKPNIPDPEPLLPFYEKVDGEWMLGYLDANGNIAIQATLKGTGTYFEGGTARIEYNGNWTFIDIYGHEVESPSWSYSGLHLVKQNNKYGYADKTGRIVIPLQYERADEFKCNRAIVKFGDYDYGFITPKGEIIIRGKFGMFIPYPPSNINFYSNYAVVKQANGKYGFIDTNGNFQNNLGSYVHAGNFSEGLAAVKNEKGEWGYINTSGRLVIPYADCFLAAPFSEGIAVIIKLKYLCLINRRGEEVAKIKKGDYDYVYEFKEGLADASGRKYGYIDTHGNIVIPLEYEEVSGFEKGFAKVKPTSPNYWVWINKSGRILKDKYGRPYHSKPEDN